jgi:hypothetical protein
VRLFGVCSRSRFFFIYLLKGLLTLEEQPGRAKDLLGSPGEGFIKPIFYPKGVAAVLKEISGVHLMDNKKTGDQLALEYALAAAVLHPYGRNLEILQLAARKMYWRLGENMTVFNKSWQALKEKLWSMESEPFSDLRYVMKSFQENGIHYVETAIEEAKKAIHDELFRK